MTDAKDGEPANRPSEGYPPKGEGTGGVGCPSAFGGEEEKN